MNMSIMANMDSGTIQEAMDFSGGTAGWNETSHEVNTVLKPIKKAVIDNLTRAYL